MTDLATVPGQSLADRVIHEAFWRDNFQGLTIGGAVPAPGSNGPAPEALDLAHRRMVQEGYFQETHPLLGELAPRLAQAVVRLVELDLPTPFLFMFDEAWNAFRALGPMVAHHLGEDYMMLPDFWVWHVDPKAGQAGWTPHRDKGAMSLAPDGSPLSLTIWVPLTAATPQNGCMYIVPADKDRLYGTPNMGQIGCDPAAIRALPVVPGEYLCWNQAVMHWGGQTSPFAPHPRISMAFEFQRGGMRPFNEPQMKSDVDLSFEQRLRLIAKQILQYQHMYPLRADVREAAETILQRVPAPV
ncbi:MAG: phytanoyl-CoA dioxygenase family protein [Proteobacteria bacterium]|nr:phytanoyl-CoA dioxygenase family protein [Pseudomonadota bacterium]